jgi:hypothetical protein
MDVYLVAQEFTKTMPDAVGITMWGFARTSDSNCATPTIIEGPSVPGPRITVPSSETTLNIHVCNQLADPVSVVIPGQITTMTPVFFTEGEVIYPGNSPRRHGNLHLE